MLPIKTKIRSEESYLKAKDSHVNPLISFLRRYCVWTTYWYTHLECVCAVWLRRVCHKRETWMNWLCLFCYRECCSAGLSVMVNMSDKACFSTLDLQRQKDPAAQTLWKCCLLVSIKPPYSSQQMQSFEYIHLGVVWRAESEGRQKIADTIPETSVGFLLFFFNKCHARTLILTD